MGYVTILVTDVEGVRMITLNRPERRNAMTPEMQQELIAAMEEAAASDCSVVVFAGAGEAFCAGLDLSALQGMNDKSAADHTADAERIARLFRTLYELPKPTIAAVHGAAIAGGTGLATMCDFTLAVPGAKFGYTEVRIGFVPAVVSAFLVLQIGEKPARDLLLTGRIFTSDEAARLGLVTEVVAADKLTARTLELVGMLRAEVFELGGVGVELVGHVLGGGEIAAAEQRQGPAATAEHVARGRSVPATERIAHVYALARLTDMPDTGQVGHG